jgi:hypothetical protein
VLFAALIFSEKCAMANEKEELETKLSQPIGEDDIGLFFGCLDKKESAMNKLYFLFLEKREFIFFHLCLLVFFLIDGQVCFRN